MRICIIAEGCYPYTVGGVSGWVHNLIQSFPEQEFVILSVISDRSLRGKYIYELPDQVTEVHELYLDDFEWGRKRRKQKKLRRKEYHALRSLLLNRQADWETLFDLFQEEKLSPNDILMGEDFLHAVTEFYNLHYSQMVFTDFLWMMRSIYLPLVFTLQMKIPKADVYHCVSTGYAGVLGSMAKYLHGGRLIISEHGIYTREREEELIKAKWVQGIYKNIWIEQFQKMAHLAYGRADVVVSLFEQARELQLEEGCQVEKTMIIPNGIRLEDFRDLPGRTAEDAGRINVGAILRVTPVKDVMTLIQAFGFAKEKEPALRLFVIGPWEEDEDYAAGCFELIQTMGIEDVVFTGKADVRAYYGRMDMTILTSISEGQPLTILESFAARKPVIATDVGNCRELILGEKSDSSRDDFGEAGIITRIMNVEEIAGAVLQLAHNETGRRVMGENGYRRVAAAYQMDRMLAAYRNMYAELTGHGKTTGKKEGTE